MRDIGRNVLAAVGISPGSLAVGTTSGNGVAAVDTVGFHDVLVMRSCGTVPAGATLDVKVQESDDGLTNWLDIPGAAFPTASPTDQNTVMQGRIKMTPSRKRYLQAVATVAGSAATAGVAFVLSDPNNAQVIEPAFSVIS